MTAPRISLRPGFDQAVAARAIAWGLKRLGTPAAPGQCCDFLAAALASGGARLSARDIRAMLLRGTGLCQGIPAWGAVTVYRYAPTPTEGMPQETGFCALSLGGGDVLYPWNVVRQDHYLVIPQLYPLEGQARSQYLGWIPLAQLLHTLPGPALPGQEAS